MTPRRDMQVGPKLRARSLKGERGVAAVSAAPESVRNARFKEEEGLPTPLYIRGKWFHWIPQSLHESKWQDPLNWDWIPQGSPADPPMDLPVTR